jgi:hypothetical protein
VQAVKPAQEFRILSFGDSFAYSIMSYEYSYSGVAARSVQAAMPEPRVRIVNLGEPATSLNDYRAAYQYWSSVLHPDAAIFCIFLGNDLLDIAFKYTPPRWTPNRVFADKDFHIADGSKRSHVPHKFPLRIFDYAYAYSVSFLYAPRALPQPTRPDPRYNIAADNDFIQFPEAVYFEVNMKQTLNFDFSRIDTLVPGYAAVYDFLRFASDVLRNGQQLLVVLAPSELQVDATLRTQLTRRYQVDFSDYDWTLPARVIMDIASLVNPALPLVDLTAYFQCRQDAGATLYHERNTHWNLAGNALAGEVIASHILENWFGVAAALPRDLQACVKEKTEQPQGVSSEAIHAFVSSRIQPNPAEAGQLTQEAPH